MANYPGRSARELWERCNRLVSTDDAVSAWLQHRGFNVEAVEDADVCRALPVSAPLLPPWANRWRGEFRAVLPLYDADGELQSLVARRHVFGARSRSKELKPSGHQARGLVLADLQGQAMLRGDAWLRDAWGDEAMVIIAEGSPAFLYWATYFGEAADSPAVIGIVGSGSWTEAHAAKVPDGATVLLRLKENEAGRKYEADIAATVKARCRVGRRKRDA